MNSEEKKTDEKKVDPRSRFVGTADEITFPQCNHCVHDRGNITCEAFPEGIPDDIFGNDIKHDHSVYGEKVWFKEDPENPVVS